MDLFSYVDSKSSLQFQVSLGHPAIYLAPCLSFYGTCKEERKERGMEIKATVESHRPVRRPLVRDDSVHHRLSEALCVTTEPKKLKDLLATHLFQE